MWIGHGIKNGGTIKLSKTFVDLAYSVGKGQNMETQQPKIAQKFWVKWQKL